MIAVLRRRFQVPFSWSSPMNSQRDFTIPALRRHWTVALFALMFGLTLFLFPSKASAQTPSEHKPFHALAFYTTKGEQDHIDFALQALRFYGDLAKKGNFSFDSTTDWNDM